jgi:hypothetical protein
MVPLIRGAGTTLRWSTVSVFDRLRSISFCKFLADGQSPSCTALKILPRSHRTCSSWRRQSTRS